MNNNVSGGNNDYRGARMLVTAILLFEFVIGLLCLIAAIVGMVILSFPQNVYCLAGVVVFSALLAVVTNTLKFISSCR